MVTKEITKNIVSMIANMVECHPENTAIEVDGIPRFSYIEMWHSAHRVASMLDKREAGSYVALDIEKSDHYIIALLGVMVSGRAFIPFDTCWPETRKNYIVSQTQALVLKRRDIGHLPVCDNYEAPIIRWNQQAYIIYTSGTSGTPKGVIVTHNGLTNLVESQNEAFGTNCYDRSLFYLSTCFDASVSDIFTILTSGATICIETQSQMKVAAHLLEIIYNRKISIIDMPPSLLKFLKTDDCPDCLRTIIIGGEAADIATVRRWAAILNIVNVYGPTEATVCSSLCRCTSKWNQSIIGQPIKGVTYIVMDENAQPANDGELWITGDCLALGYLNNEVLTNTKFIMHRGKRYYRTGDRVRITNDGEYEFHGRIDRQVKLNGKLIEPEEIEVLMNSMPNVNKSAVVVLGKGTNKHLVAFVDSSFFINANDIEAFLVKQVPEWMIPKEIHCISIPLTSTGKIDYRKLQEDYTKTDAASTTDYDASLTKQEQTFSSKECLITDIIAEILERSDIGQNEHLCQLGFSSLQYLELICQLETIGIYMTTEDLRDNSTAHQIALFADANTAMARDVASLKNEWESECLKREEHVPNPELKTVLLTGATGFLGIHLLKDMTDDDAYSSIICLVRAENNNMALQRVRDTAIRFGLAFNESDWKRVVAVCGDICQPLLGMASDDYHRLCRQVSVVYHCAAVVNMMEGYECLKSSNVDGLINILHFCSFGCKKQLHYASTLSVRVATDDNTGVVYETFDTLDGVHQIYGGYGQTKFVAEKILQNVNPDVCEIFIYRFGLLCGHTQTGTSAPKDFLCMFFNGAKTLGALPYDTSKALAIDITPIDFAAHTMYRLSKRHGEYHIFHIAKQQPYFYNDLANDLLNCGLISKVVEYSDWCTIVEQYKKESEVQACRLALCRFDEKLFSVFRYMDLFQSTNIRFDMSHTQSVLPDISYPIINSKIISLYAEKM